MRLAINGDFAPPDAGVGPGDEVDVLPPVAGGAAVTLARIDDAPLSVDEVLAAVSHPGAGGIALFIGTVRDHADGLEVARLDYEAHPTLAAKELSRVLDWIANKRSGVRLVAGDRVGSLRVGDLAVVVAASAAHRAEAFEACRLAIERIKETVPIWKHEWDSAGSAHWVNLDTGGAAPSGDREG